MDTLLTQLPSWIVTAIIGLIGIGVGWGFLKSEVSALKTQQEKIEVKMDALIVTVGLKTDCLRYREDCKLDISKKFDEISNAIEENKHERLMQMEDIKRAIVTNRETVLSKFEEIREFVGYVKAKIEEFNKK